MTELKVKNKKSVKKIIFSFTGITGIIAAIIISWYFNPESEMKEMNVKINELLVMVEKLVKDKEFNNQEKNKLLNEIFLLKQKIKNKEEKPEKLNRELLELKSKIQEIEKWDFGREIDIDKEEIPAGYRHLYPKIIKCSLDNYKKDDFVLPVNSEIWLDIHVENQYGLDFVQFIFPDDSKMVSCLGKKIFDEQIDLIIFPTKLGENKVELLVAGSKNTTIKKIYTFKCVLPK